MSLNGAHATHLGATKRQGTATSMDSQASRMKLCRQMTLAMQEDQRGEAKEDPKTKLKRQQTVQDTINDVVKGVDPTRPSFHPGRQESPEPILEEPPPSNLFNSDTTEVTIESEDPKAALLGAPPPPPPDKKGLKDAIEGDEVPVEGAPTGKEPTLALALSVSIGIGRGVGRTHSKLK